MVKSSQAWCEASRHAVKQQSMLYCACFCAYMTFQQYWLLAISMIADCKEPFMQGHGAWTGKKLTRKPSDIMGSLATKPNATSRSGSVPERGDVYGNGKQALRSCSMGAKCLCKAILTLIISVMHTTWRMLHLYGKFGKGCHLNVATVTYISYSKVCGIVLYDRGQDCLHSITTCLCPDHA